MDPRRKTIVWIKWAMPLIILGVLGGLLFGLVLGDLKEGLQSAVIGGAIIAAATVVSLAAVRH